MNTALLPMIVSGDVPSLVDSRTGEVVALTDATAEHIAATRDRILDLESQLREAKTVMDREVISRMDADRLWTIEAGPWKLSAPSPAPQAHYDAQAMRTDLMVLVDDGVLSQAAADRAVAEIVDWKASAAGIKALVKGGGQPADVVARHTTELERTRRVTVKRVG